MKIAIIVSSKDNAGLNIKESLINSDTFNGLDATFEGEKIYEYKNSIIYTIRSDSIYFDDCNNINAELLIFATRHASKNAMPALSCHVSGNWGKAEFGGSDNKLSLAPALILRDILITLDRYKDLEVFQEVSHHGPLTLKPSIFIEIGSSEEEWVKKENGKRIASVIIEMIDRLEKYEDYDGYISKNMDVKVAVGLGGLHHTPSFKSIIVDGKIAFGHICPKYNLHNLTKEMLDEAIAKTKEKVDFIVVDWKGLGEHKERITSILEMSGIPWKKTKDV